MLDRILPRRRPSQTLDLSLSIRKDRIFLSICKGEMTQKRKKLRRNATQEHYSPIDRVSLCAGGLSDRVIAAQWTYNYIARVQFVRGGKMRAKGCALGLVGADVGTGPRSPAARPTRLFFVLRLT